MEFYKIKNPKTAQFIEAIENKEYFTEDQLQQKRNQLRILLEANNYGQILITYVNVTNCGGFPIVYTSSDDLNEIAADFYNDFYNKTEEEQEEIISNLMCYAQIF